MSAKIGFLRANQPLTGEPAPIARKRAARLVRNGHCREISPGLIQEIEPEMVQRFILRGQMVNMPQLRAIRRPDWIFTSYPLADQRTVSL